MVFASCVLQAFCDPRRPATVIFNCKTTGQTVDAACSAARTDVLNHWIRFQNCNASTARQLCWSWIANAPIWWSKTSGVRRTPWNLLRRTVNADQIRFLSNCLKLGFSSLQVHSPVGFPREWTRVFIQKLISSTFTIIWERDFFHTFDNKISNPRPFFRRRTTLCHIGDKIIWCVMAESRTAFDCLKVHSETNHWHTTTSALLDGFSESFSLNDYWYSNDFIRRFKSYTQLVQHSKQRYGDVVLRGHTHLQFTFLGMSQNFKSPTSLYALNNGIMRNYCSVKYNSHVICKRPFRSTEA